MIKIFNPKEYPFGPLSNNYTHFMSIHGEEWRTVTHFIFTNMISTPTSKNIIKNTENVKDVRETFLELYSKNIESDTYTALEQALYAKFKDPQLADALIETGNARLIYESNNALLGIGENGNGHNLLGKELEQLRQRLIIQLQKEVDQQEKDKRNNKIFKIYLAKQALEKAINEGDNLQEYSDLSYDDIIASIDTTSFLNNKNQIVELYDKNLLPIIKKEFDNPGTLVIQIRAKELGNLRRQLVQQKKDIIFDMYLDNILKKHFHRIDEIDYDLAKAQQLRKMTSGETTEFKHKIYDLYESGLLSTSLITDIDVRLKTLPSLPTIEEIKEAEMAIFGNLANFNGPKEEEEEEDVFIVENLLRTPSPSPPKSPSILDELLWDIEQKNTPTQIREQIQAIRFSADPANNPQNLHFLSPITYSGLFKVNNYEYPTISHYITTYLFSKLRSIGNIDNAYKYILVNPDQPVVGPESFISIQGATQIYMEQKDKNYIDDMIGYAAIGVETKFRDRKLQDLLLLTGDRNIIYDDKSDPILGIGAQGQGMNVVGNYLMQLRTRFFEEQKDKDSHVEVTVNDVTNLLETDLFLKSWLDMRIRDICHSINTVNIYFKSKHDLEQNIDKEFVNSVLNHVYSKCTALNEINLDIDVPYWFDDVVKRYLKNLSYDVVKTLWDRIIVMASQLIDYAKDNSLHNMKLAIANFENMNSENKICYDIIDSPYENCILSGILNIMKGLHHISIEYNINPAINKVDIDSATSIILNRKVGEINNLTPNDIDADSIGAELKNINNQNDIDILTSSVYGAVNYIKNYKMPYRIKHNRINFFAT